MYCWKVVRRLLAKNNLDYELIVNTPAQMVMQLVLVGSSMSHS